MLVFIQLYSFFTELSGPVTHLNINPILLMRKFGLA